MQLKPNVAVQMKCEDKKRVISSYGTNKQTNKNLKEPNPLQGLFLPAVVQSYA